MAKGFSSSKLTLAVATAQNLATLLAAEGYTGSMVGGYLSLDKQALTDVFYGHDGTVDATVGRALATLERRAPPVIDPSRIWLFSTAGGEIGCTFEPA